MLKAYHLVHHHSSKFPTWNNKETRILRINHQTSSVAHDIYRGSNTAQKRQVQQHKKAVTNN